MNRLFISFLALLLLVTFSEVAAQNKVKVYKNKTGEKNILSKNRLNLSEEQKKLIEQINLKYETTLIDLRAELKKLNVEKKKLLAQSGFSKSEFFKLEEKIINAETKIKLERNKIKSEVYDILDDEQREKYLKGFNFFGFAFNNDMSLLFEDINALTFNSIPNFEDFDFDFDFDFNIEGKKESESEKDSE